MVRTANLKGGETNMATKRRKTARQLRAKIKPLAAAPGQQKRDQRIAAAYAKGKSRDKIADQHGLSVHTVGRIIWEQGGKALRA